MRGLLTIVLVVVLLAPLPASAGEPSGATETTPLLELIEEVEREIALYQAASRLAALEMPLPGFDLAARVEARMLRADYFLGGVRARAHDRLHSELEGVPLEVLHSVDERDDEMAVSQQMVEQGASGREVWQSAALVTAWLRLQDRLATLRRLVQAGLPERVCPVDGFTWFRDEWQVERPWERIHKGVDMHAELGQELVAIEDGVVVQANWHRLGGRQVYLRADSTGDVYYYAHLEYWPKWLWTGTRLEAGDYIGLAGSSGNADTPHLHLGWMPGSGDVDLENLQNPYPLMYELCN